MGLGFNEVNILSDVICEPFHYESDKGILIPQTGSIFILDSFKCILRNFIV